MKKRIHKYLFYTLVIIVYGVFFSVESFYNFEGHSDAKTILSQSSCITQSAGVRNVSTSPLPSPSSHKIRLNKRYQHEDFRPCAIVRVESPVAYITPRILGHHPIRPLPLACASLSSLRGPPLAV